MDDAEELWQLEGPDQHQKYIEDRAGYRVEPAVQDYLADALGLDISTEIVGAAVHPSEVDYRIAVDGTAAEDSRYGRVFSSFTYVVTLDPDTVDDGIAAAAAAHEFRGIRTDRLSPTDVGTLQTRLIDAFGPIAAVKKDLGGERIVLDP